MNYKLLLICCVILILLVLVSFYVYNQIKKSTFGPASMDDAQKALGIQDTEIVIPTSLPSTSPPSTSPPSTSPPSTSPPSTSLPLTSLPSTSLPSTSLPSTSPPSTSPPSTSPPSTPTKPLNDISVNTISAIPASTSLSSGPAPCSPDPVPTSDSLYAFAKVWQPPPYGVTYDITNDRVKKSLYEAEKVLNGNSCALQNFIPYVMYSQIYKTIENIIDANITLYTQINEEMKKQIIYGIYTLNIKPEKHADALNAANTWIVNNPGVPMPLQTQINNAIQKGLETLLITAPQGATYPNWFSNVEDQNHLNRLKQTFNDVFNAYKKYFDDTTSNKIATATVNVFTDKMVIEYTKALTDYKTFITQVATAAYNATKTNKDPDEMALTAAISQIK
jgi:hypothetical protein